MLHPTKNVDSEQRARESERSIYDKLTSGNGQTAYHEDVHSPQAVANGFNRFKKHISDLQEQLGKFQAECRQLGRSYALTIATHDFREGLGSLLSKFHENAIQLSPDMQEHSPMIDITVDTDKGSFPYWLEGVAAACDICRERLAEFREYTDESVKIKKLLASFSKDLRYRASCLKEHANFFNHTYMRRYIHDLMHEMEEDLDNLKSMFEFFIRYGMPVMQYEQRRDTNVLLNMSTVATFLSAVTATALQTSVGSGGGTAFDPTLTEIVNTFWFCSLVLSIGAALNSLLAVLWKSTPYGTRGHRLPVWVTVWIHASAPAFLAISIASFSAGLALFAYASGQKQHTKIVTLVTTGITSFGILFIVSWFAYEQYVAPLLLPDAPWRLGTKRIHEWTKGLSEKNETFRPSLFDHRRTRTGSLSGFSDTSTESSHSSFNIIPSKIASRLPVSAVLSKVASLQPHRHDLSATTERPKPSVDLESQPQNAPSLPTNGTPLDEKQFQKARSLWSRSAKLIMNTRSVSKALQQGSDASPATLPIPPTLPATRLVASPLSLRFPLEPTSSLSLPTGVLQDMEYSPDGRFLAITSVEMTSGATSTTIYIVNETYTSLMYTHQKGTNSKQVAWSPNSDKLLVRLDHSIDFLDENSSLISTIKRPHFVESAAWLSQLNAFLSVERSTVYEMTIEGQIRKKHRFDNILLRDVAVVPETDLLLVTGRVMHFRREILPTNGRAEKQVILYDTQTQESLTRHPILDDVRYLQVSRTISKGHHGFDILLNHKNRSSPHLWTLRPDPKGPHQLAPEVLTLHPTSEWTGYGYFIGEEDQMLAYVGINDIHILDRESKRPIHRIKTRSVDGGLRRFAWRSSPTMSAITFASVDEKEIKIWSVEQPSAPGPHIMEGAVTVDEPDGLLKTFINAMD